MSLFSRILKKIVTLKSFILLLFSRKVSKEIFIYRKILSPLPFFNDKNFTSRYVFPPL